MLTAVEWDSYLVFNFIDGAWNSGAKVLHTDMNVFHCVVCMRIVKDKRFLNFLVVMCQLFYLWPVSLNSRLKGGTSYITVWVTVTNLVGFEFTNLLFKGTVHFECNTDDLFGLLLNPWTKSICLLRKLQSKNRLVRRYRHYILIIYLSELWCCCLASSIWSEESRFGMKVTTTCQADSIESAVTVVYGLMPNSTPY